MVILHFETKIHAAVEKVFDMARTVEVHLETAAHTQEKAVGGKTSGLLEKGNTIVWEARHLGVRQRLTAEIVEMEPHSFFEDQMLRGAFAFLRHKHSFESTSTGTLMKDQIEFEAPWGILGRFAEFLFLKRHMSHFLVTKNEVFKVLVENTGEPIRVEELGILRRNKEE